MYQFKESSLNYIWLSNGYREEALKNYGRCVSFTDVVQLERAIAISLIQHCCISGNELRFLRLHLAWSVKRFAKRLGYSIKEIELFEMSDDPVDQDVVGDIRNLLAGVFDLDIDEFTQPAKPSRISCELVGGQWRCNLDFTKNLID